jgi:hypothetical protein
VRRPSYLGSIRINTRNVVLSLLLLLTLGRICAAQEVAQLNPNSHVTVDLEGNEEKAFVIELNSNAFAEIEWLVTDEASLSLGIYDLKRATLLRQLDPFEKTLSFFAPRGRYLLVARISNDGRARRNTISLQYRTSFSIPGGARLKATRKINGYDIQILSTKVAGGASDSIVAILRNGVVSGGLRAPGGDIGGHSFGDDVTSFYTPKGKRGAKLVSSTTDKTGDGIPDVMINYYSGGAHCCSLTYFLNLEKAVELVEFVNTSHDGLIATKMNPDGGLVFEVGDTSWAYWPDGFAGSAFPTVVLVFEKNRLRPSLKLMKKPPPSFGVLRSKAGVVRSQLSEKPYYGFDKEGATNFQGRSRISTLSVRRNAGLNLYGQRSACLAVFGVGVASE